MSVRRLVADAPEGKESWFVMINVPANSGQDWQQLRLLARERILHKLKRITARRY
jgi:phytoene desaturase